MEADIITAKVPGHKGASDNFISLGQAAYIDPTSIIGSVEFLSKHPNEKIVNSFKAVDKHLGIFGASYLTVYTRKFFFFKKKKLIALINTQTGDYEIIESDIPLGEKIRFKISFENPNRCPRYTGLDS